MIHAGIERLAAVVSDMKESVPGSCRHAKAAMLVLQEVPVSPMRAAVESDIAALMASQREVCLRYNNLRARLAELELHEGVEHPKFYVGTVRGQGQQPTDGCNCLPLRCPK